MTSVQLYIDTVEKLSKSRNLREGNIEQVTKEILEQTANVLDCERTNAWLLNKERNALDNICSYHNSTSEFKVDPSINGELVPNYFEHLTKNKIIVSNDAVASEFNRDILDIYIKPLRITSMMDIPLRSEGEMIGVICFEHVDKAHQWTPEEQKFALLAAGLLSMALETNKKRLYQNELEKMVKEKEVLISEITHRVKNNMALILGLINIQKYKCKDEFHRGLLLELENKVFTMSKVQETLRNTKNYDRIDLAQYLEDLIVNQNNTYGEGKGVKLNLDFDHAEINISKAIPCGLIANEILTNSFKYAFNGDNENPEMTVVCKVKGDKVYLKFKDNGPGIHENRDENSNGMGMGLIMDLSDQLDADLKINTNHGVEIELEFEPELLEKLPQENPVT